MLVNEFMKAMRLEFGMFEFKAISPQGHQVKSEGWIDQTYSLEIIPQIQWKEENANRLATGSPQHPTKTPARKSKQKTRAAP